MAVWTSVWRFVVSFFGWVYCFFGYMGPIWLLFHLAFSSYVVFYLYCYLFLLGLPELTDMFDLPPGVSSPRIMAYFLFGFLAFLKVNWFGSWLMGFIITHFMDRDYMPHTKAKIIMQGKGFTPGTTARWEPNDRPRICPKCERRCPDRVYHDSWTDRCLPIFDHYCPWIHISVYSRTIKAYLYFLFFLLCDIFGTFAVIVVALIQQRQGLWPYVAGGAFAFVALLVGGLRWGPKQWKHLAFNNEIKFEYRKPRKPILLAFKVTEGGRDLVHFEQIHGNPWDRGYVGNLRQVLGSSWWMWLMFWWQPERVARYGRYDPNIDLPYSDEVWAKRNQVIASLSERRLAAQSWSGSAAPPTRPRRVQSRSAEQASPIHGEESSELRRRMIRTS